MTLLALALATTFSITHTPIDCIVKGRVSVVSAQVQPVGDVAHGRVYFRRSTDVEPYAVPMVLKQGAFEGRLPKASDTGAIVYFLEVVGQDGSMRRTADMEATVVKRAGACTGAVVAGDGGDIDVVVFAKDGRKPAGFGGIARVDTLAKATVADVPVPAPAKDEPHTAPPNLAAEGDDYRVGPGDVLRITVYGHEDLTQVVTVQADGTFTFPLLGRVTAANVLLRDLQRNLAAGLGKGFVRNPQVTVLVQEYRSQNVFVVGEVSRPGTYALEGTTTVVEILAKAGPTPNAGHEVVVVRPRTAVEGPLLPTEVDASGASAEVIRVNVRDIRLGKLEQNIVLRPRDTIFVSEASRVFVSGEVKAGGAFTFNPGMTVRQAISMAGGFTPEASSGRVRVVRRVDGRMREVKIQLDDPVEPGDTVLVKPKRF